MRCGLYGKIASKRDFIAIATPRTFLDAFEPWLQSSLQSSRLALGSAWQPHFLRAPIWRFWLGADIAGSGVFGAMMPSLDGVGRYFPLVILCPSDPGRPLQPPVEDAQEAWMSAAERLLLATLADAATFDGVVADLQQMPLPEIRPRPVPEGCSTLAGGALRASLTGKDPAPVMAGLVRHDQDRVLAGHSFWWTLGGEGFAPAALSARGLPHPSLFAGMLGAED
jgi:type VI secretion system protein ImpM